MKLAIATGVLAQALPTFSRKTVDLIPQQSLEDNFAKTLSLSDKKDADGSLVKAHNRRRALLANLPSTKIGTLTNQRRRVSNQGTTKNCNPDSNDADVGILSCGSGMFCKPSEDSVLGGRCEVNESPNMGWSKVVNGHSKGGLLKNFKPTSGAAPTVECDPALTADIGILSCGENEQCVASSLSGMGGFCRSSVSRQLSTNDALCDPSSGLSQPYNCDCSGFDNITGTGDVTCTNFEDFCLGLLYPGCGAACMSRTVTYSFVNFTAPVYTFCLEFQTPYEQKICIEETLTTETCVITLDDQPCNSCSIQSEGNMTSKSFECSNVGSTNGTTAYGLTTLIPILDSCYKPSTGSECKLCTADNTVFDSNSYRTPVTVPNLSGNFSCYDLLYTSYAYASISDDICPAVAATAAGACCATICEICGTGKYIPTENYDILVNIPLSGYESATCLDLYVAAYYNVTITSDLCPSATSVAQSKCCVPYAEQRCDICDGEALASPKAVVSVYGYDLPCNALDTFLNETACANVQPRVAATCCGTKNNDDAPTSAPSPTTAEQSSPSSSSTLGFAKSIASAVGLATVALIYFVK